MLIGNWLADEYAMPYSVAKEMDVGSQVSVSLVDKIIERSLAPADVKIYSEQGYLLVGRTLTDTGLDAMRKQCMHAWNAEKTQYDPDGTWLKNALMTNIHHGASIVRDFYFEGPIVDVACQLIGPNIKGATSQLTFKMRGNTQPFGWHQDNGYGELDPYNTISTLTALDDADEQNGCLWIIPGSHRRGQIDVSSHSVQAKSAQKAIELTVDEATAIPVPMRAGETLVFHCWTLHKSNGNLAQERDRRLLFLRYADADAVEVYNNRRPRLGRLLRGTSQFHEVREFEAAL